MMNLYSVYGTFSERLVCAGGNPIRINDYFDWKDKESKMKIILDGQIFYITFIDDTQKLQPFYHRYCHQYQCLFQKDIYTQQQWLEIMPQGTSKAHAIQQLKHIYHYDHLVVFGDGENDIEMFQLADEAYAVENAHERLKAYATDIIPSNNQDGVAQFLKQTWKKL